MPNRAGYTLDQLLSWCQEDRLIDSYERRGGRVVIIQGAARFEMAGREAERFLKAAFRDAQATAPLIAQASATPMLSRRRNRA